MKKNQDIALKSNDLNILNGDLQIAESDPQHIADTINAFPGWWKEKPADGVGVFAYLNSAGTEQTIKRILTIQLTADGYQLRDPVVKRGADGFLNINPNAEA